MKLLKRKEKEKLLKKNERRINELNYLKARDMSSFSFVSFVIYLAQNNLIFVCWYTKLFHHKIPSSSLLSFSLSINYHRLIVKASEKRKALIFLKPDPFLKISDLGSDIKI